jgi:serine/threonine protein phosphatase PrpC
MESYVLQNVQKQDAALHGSTDDFDYLIVSDSHGRGFQKHRIRDLINTIDWFSILQNENWYKNDTDAEGNYISPLFAALHNINSDDRVAFLQGCTLSVVLIYPDKFECFSIGDSTIKIWGINPEEKDIHRVFESEDHDINYTEDVTLLESRTFKDALFCRNHWPRDRGCIAGVSKTDKELRIKVYEEDISNKSITMEQSAYFYFDDGSKIDMTRALGHYPSSGTVECASLWRHKLSLCEYSLTKKIIERVETTNYMVIVGTDGIWDVVNKEMENDFAYWVKNSSVGAAERIACNAEMLWLQEWKFIYNGREEMTTMPESGRDDIAVAVAYC